MEKKMQPSEELKKSIDKMIDELFLEEKKVKKSMDHIEPKATADEAIAAAPSGEMDEARGAGRPKQISEIPQVDMDGKRAGKYDSDVVEEEGKEEEMPEASQVKSGKRKKEEEKESSEALPGMAEGAKAEAPLEGESEEVPSSEALKEDDSIEARGIKKALKISEAEYKEYVALKKARDESRKAEILKKAKEEHRSLIKSAVMEATADIRKENESLRKSLIEQNDLIKAMANKPKAPTAITSMAALEKGGSSAARSNTLSKSELVDIAERLVKSGELPVEAAIELDQTGFIYEPEMRGILEREIKKARR